MYNVSLGGLNMRIKLWKVEQYHNPLEKKVGNSVNTSLCTMYRMSQVLMIWVAIATNC